MPGSTWLSWFSRIPSRKQARWISPVRLRRPRGCGSRDRVRGVRRDLPAGADGRMSRAAPPFGVFVVPRLLPQVRPLPGTSAEGAAGVCFPGHSGTSANSSDCHDFNGEERGGILEAPSRKTENRRHRGGGAGSRIGCGVVSKSTENCVPLASADQTPWRCSIGGSYSGVPFRNP